MCLRFVARPLVLVVALSSAGASCGDPNDAELDEDASASEPGDRDASETNDEDASRVDSGRRDAGANGERDGSSVGPVDGGMADARVDDAGMRDAGRDAGPNDASATDAMSARDGGGVAGTDGGPLLTRSAGCGQAAQASGDFERRTVRVLDRERVYHVRLPDNYVASRAYPVIFRWHGYTGDGLSGGLDIQYAAASAAIVVGADGLNEGWDESSEQNDLALFDAMYDALAARYCVDLSRVFSYGFSMGGGMNNLLSCARADKVRGAAAVAGYNRGTGTCTKPVAAWFMHDRDDDDVLVAEGIGARDRMRARNHCSDRTVAAGTDCVRYEGCDPGYPVVWCETRGKGHNIAGDVAPALVWDFFRTLP
jgi:polyhydroxybutyrate depolymerase